MLSYLRLIFGRRYRVPRDRTTRVSRAARTRAKPQIQQLDETIDTIAGLPGLSDLARTKIVPAGFYRAVKRMWASYDSYAEEVRQGMSLQSMAQAGQGRGVAGCYTAPMGVSPAESLTIAQGIASRTDLPKLAQALQNRAQQVLEDIQSQQKQPNAQKADPYALQKGRHRYHARGLACPFLDEDKGQCSIPDLRPISCRMHHVGDPVERLRADHPEHKQANVFNIRLPARTQVSLTQHVDKRLGEISPLMFAGVLQAFEMGKGHAVREHGQSRPKIGRDGRQVAPANRNVKGSKKQQKQRQKQKRRETRR